MKKLLLTVLLLTSISAFASNINDNRIVFAFVVSPMSLEMESWQETTDIIQEYFALLQQNKIFTIALLDQGLQTVQRMFDKAQEKGNIAKWALINVDPDEFAKKFEGLPYRYLKFELEKERVTPEQWLQLEKQTQELISYGENNSDLFTFSYYFSKIIELFRPFLPQ